MMKKENYKYRVYVETIISGRVYGNFLPEQYEDAKSLYEQLVVEGQEAVYLQEIHPEHGGVTKTLEKHVTQSYKDRNKEYWKLKEDESVTWVPGKPHGKGYSIDVCEAL